MRPVHRCSAVSAGLATKRMATRWLSRANAQAPSVSSISSASRTGCRRRSKRSILRTRLRTCAPSTGRDSSAKSASRCSRTRLRFISPSTRSLTYRTTRRRCRTTTSCWSPCRSTRTILVMCICSRLRQPSPSSSLVVGMRVRCVSMILVFLVLCIGIISWIFKTGYSLKN